MEGRVISTMFAVNTYELMTLCDSSSRLREVGVFDDWFVQRNIAEMSDL